MLIPQLVIGDIKEKFVRKILKSLSKMFDMNVTFIEEV